jgi:uncharacterized protein DUF4446
MNFSTHTLSLLTLIAVGLGVLALGFSLAGGATPRRLKIPGDPIALDETLRGVLEGHAGQIKRLENAVRTLNATDKRQQIGIEGGIRRIGLLRYDAFEDVGGRLSFSCALLDDHGTGVVLTSINGRQETRVYAKPVTVGNSSYNLSAEEQEAIGQALSSPQEEAAR